MKPPLLAGSLLAGSLALLAACVSPGPAREEPRQVSFRRGVNISHWLSQMHRGTAYADPWITADDFAWIAAHGFDHVRLPVDGRLLQRDDGSLDPDRMVPIDAALDWSRASGLGLILDMHFLPGASFEEGYEPKLFTDAALQARCASLWRQLATHFRSAGPELRFELLNEPVARENAQLNTLNRTLLAAIREVDPTRVVYLTSNRWGNFSTVSDLEVPDDPNVAFTFHFYEPFIFTHQAASWTEYTSRITKVVPFPGPVPDLRDLLPADHWGLNRDQGRVLEVARDIDEPFARLAEWANRAAPGREIHIGEFGAYQLQATPDSVRAWTAAVREASERHGFGWAIWDYKGGFAVRSREGQPTAAHEGLFPARR